VNELTNHSMLPTPRPVAPSLHPLR